MKHYIEPQHYSTSTPSYRAAGTPINTGFISDIMCIGMSVEERHKNKVEEAARAQERMDHENERTQSMLDARAAQERAAIDKSWQSEWAKMHPTQSQIDMEQYRKNVADREARERAEVAAQERMFQDTGTTSDEWDEYEAQTMLEELKAQNNSLTQKRIDEARRAGLI